MPNKKSVLLVILAFVAGFFGMSAHLGILPQLSQRLTEEAQPLINLGRSIYTRWTSLPQAMQGIILAGVPTLFMVFFAWTKSRAMKKLEQTQLQSKMQYNQLTGEIGELESQKTELQSQVKAYADGNEAIKTLTTNLEEATNLVSQKQREIDVLQKHVAELTGQIQGMKTQIEYVQRLK